MAVSNVVRDHLDVEDAARCEDGAAVFQVTNLGDRWPRLGEINIYRANKRTLISKRRIRLANSQQATFMVRKSFKSPGWPVARSATRSPTASMTPAGSLPGLAGRGGAHL